MGRSIYSFVLQKYINCDICLISMNQNQWRKLIAVFIIISTLLLYVSMNFEQKGSSELAENGENGIEVHTAERVFGMNVENTAVILVVVLGLLILAAA